MKVRQLRKRQQLKLGFMETIVNARYRTDDMPYDPWSGKKLKRRRFRMLIKEGRGFNCWAEERGKPWYRRHK